MILIPLLPAKAGIQVTPEVRREDQLADK